MAPLPEGELRQPGIKPLEPTPTAALIWECQRWGAGMRAAFTILISSLRTARYYVYRVKQ